MNPLGMGILLRCFFRSYVSSAAYNPHSLQSIGITYAIEPALASLYGPGDALQSARERYVKHFNTYPFWVPLLLGVFLRIEQDIAAKRIQPALLDALKDTTANTLSAIGDSLFQGSLMATWALVCACFIQLGLPGAAICLTIGAFCMVHTLRLFCFVAGLRKGMAVLLLLRRMQLIEWSGRIKYVNAVLLVLFLYLMLPGTSLAFGGAALFWLLAAGVLAGRVHMPRALLAYAALVCMGVAHYFFSLPV